MAVEITRDLKELKAQAEGKRPSVVNGLFEGPADAVGTPQYTAMAPAERLALGYYLCARRRKRTLSEGA